MRCLLPILNLMAVALVLLCGPAIPEGKAQGRPPAFRGGSPEAPRGGGPETPAPALREVDEYRLGRAVAAGILAKYPLLQDRRITLYVNEVGLTVARKSLRPTTFRGYHFGVLDTAEPNTFSCPGGIILISREVLKMCDNEDELAAVLAHEVAHVARRDGVRAIRQSRRAEVVAPLRVQAAKERGGQKLEALAEMFEGSVEDVAKTMMVKGFSRATELGADREALRTLQAAGYNPRALATFLRKMSAYEERGWIRFKTHPPAKVRLAQIKAQLDESPAENSLWQVRVRRFQAQKPF